MSLLAPFIKRAKLNQAIKKTGNARASGGTEADGWYQASYQGYAEVLRDDPLRADALYHWGFALLHQAKGKTGAEAADLYQEAIGKFAFCLLINPDYLGAALDGGVAYMDLARLNAAPPDHAWYGLAQQQFERANRIQKSVASYNLACLHALRGDMDACRKALDSARNHGALPSGEDMLADPDMANAAGQDWFAEFLAALPAANTAQPAAADQAAPPQATGG